VQLSAPQQFVTGGVRCNGIILFLGDIIIICLSAWKISSFTSADLPMYNGGPGELFERTTAESVCKHVSSTVGMIEVSTLGRYIIGSTGGVVPLNLYLWTGGICQVPQFLAALKECDHC